MSFRIGERGTHDVAKDPRRHRLLIAGVAIVATVFGGRLLPHLGSRVAGSSTVRPNLEDVEPGGGFYNPATQSFLRSHHWLDTVERLEIVTHRRGTATVRLAASRQDHSFDVANLDLRQLVPRLHYEPAAPPDDFDAFNLMLAEYSRNGLSVPVGQNGDRMAHFETTLSDEVPWSLAGDYEFEPNPGLRPLRFSVINNCLEPGLWELAATDRAGEIYHSWFDFPLDLYYRLVAAANEVEEPFARRAVEWRTEPVPLRLERLRTDPVRVGTTAVELMADAEVGFSTQGSRRKLAKNYALVGTPEKLRKPESRLELTSGPVFLSDFVPPGKYSLARRKQFDVRFLTRPLGAEVRRVAPRTRYKVARGAGEAVDGEELHYLEIDIQLEGFRLLLGNLPAELLVPQEDFGIHGFGVGVLEADSLAERRQILIDRGPAPSFAYLLEERDGRSLVLNSHEYGIEQVFVRTHSRDASPWWEITITSFERIVDLLKYRVDIPAELAAEMRAHGERYIRPLYFSYRDDNLR